jgi:uncharacterized lipoprotein YddW (UPF0748 family)
MEEGRAVWIHANLFKGAEEETIQELDRLLDGYAALGINHLFCFNAMTDQHRKGWDFLDALLKAAHARGIQVHPIFFPGHRLRLEGEMEVKPEWLIRGLEGEVHPHLNPAHPGARAHVVSKVKRALEYDIDGIHLDYIRFPVKQCFSYDPWTCEAFKKEYGVSPSEVVPDIGSMYWCEWIRWNANQVTALVREVRAAMEQSGRKLCLSAAVFPDPDSARVMIGQDWAFWAREGLVDLLCPMLYVNDPDLFEGYVKKAMRAAGETCPVYPGIALKSSHNTNTPKGAAEEVRRARAAGAQGVTFFSGHSLTQEVMYELAATVFREE